MTWTVHKFGGTSVADASCIRRVADIVGGQETGNLGVVVSAMKGVTDDLLGLVEKAARREPIEPTLKALRARHEKACVELLGAAGAKARAGGARRRADRHRKHPEGRVARSLRVEPQPRPRRGFRRGVVRTADRGVLQAGVRQEARRHVPERARRARDRAERDGARRRLGSVAAEARGCDTGRFPRRRGHHGLRGSGSRRPADDARPQRQRLLRRRSSARCSMRTKCTSGPTSTAS